MQLNDRLSSGKSIRGKLSAAVLTVLSSVSHVEAATATKDTTDIDSAVLHYQENGGRVATTEAVVQVKQVIDDDSSLGVNFTYDTLSGGSPNGALPSKGVQTFARPSGSSLVTTTTTTPVQTYTTASGQVVTSGGGTSTSGPYTVAPGKLPMDKSFHDQREAIGLNWTNAVTPLTQLIMGGNYSHETDFQSLSGSASIAQDFNEKNTTLSAGVNIEEDWIRPIGGAPAPMSDYALFEKQGNKTKQVDDVLVGLSQIMNRRWITQLNWSLDKSSGYQNDPYKILSAIDADGNTIGYVYENRPRDRNRKSIYWENKFAFNHDTLDFSVRHMTDDWGITSNTADVHYRWVYSRNYFVEPQYRYYHQTAANFYHLYLQQGAPLVPYASGDPRLAEFDASTIGVKWGVALDKTTELSARFQLYDQRGKTPNSVPTALQGLNLYPGLKSQLFEIGFKAKF